MGAPCKVNDVTEFASATRRVAAGCTALDADLFGGRAHRYQLITSDVAHRLEPALRELD